MELTWGDAPCPVLAGNPLICCSEIMTYKGIPRWLLLKLKLGDFSLIFFYRKAHDCFYTLIVQKVKDEQ